MGKFWIGVLLLPALGGCATLPYLRAGFDPSQKMRAIESWRYAQLAYNVYHREKSDPGKPPSPAFELDPDFDPIEDEQNDNDDVGLAYNLYRVKSEPGRLIAVFRGTEPDGCDWKHGNFRLHQQERATGNLLRYLRDRSIPPERVILVGHSLGGAIATHLSYRLPGSRSYVFNASPQFRKPRPYELTATDSDGAFGPRRVSIATRGEFLRIARGPAREANQWYIPYRCASGGIVARHSMRTLALCLTDIAAGEQPSNVPASPGTARWSQKVNKALYDAPPPDTTRRRKRCA